MESEVIIDIPLENIPLENIPLENIPLENISQTRVIKSQEDKIRIIKTKIIISIIFIFLYIIVGVLVGIYWIDLSWEGWVSLYVVISVLFVLILDLWNAALTFFGAMIFLLLCRIINLDEALKGFSDSAVGTIALLFIVASAIRETGILEQAVRKILRTPSNIYRALLLFVPIVVLLSAFTNNTPIVLMFITMLQSWSIKTQLPLNQMLMPLSFASILGGTCTIIGTSTNLVVQGLALNLPIPIDLGFFNIGMLGLPLAAIGIIYMVLFAKLLLPELTLKRKYIPVVSNMYKISYKSKYINKRLSNTNLTKIPGITLVRIRLDSIKLYNIRSNNTRKNFIIPDINYVLNEGDVLYFIGVEECLQDISGLTKENNIELINVGVFECKISDSDNDNDNKYNINSFMDHFNCRILTVNRNGKMISDVNEIKGGDIITVESGYMFLHYNRFSYFKSIKEILPIIQNIKNPKIKILHQLIILILFIAMITLAIVKITTLFSGAGVIVCTVIGLRIIDWNKGISSINSNIIILIACSFSLSLALIKTGVSVRLASMLTVFNDGGTYSQLLGIYLITNLLSAVISNVAAATIMFPIVISIVETTGLNIYGALYTLMVAASFAFITPIGYQTNLMVQEEGGYTWGDFIKFGGPLSLGYLFITPAISMGIWK